MRRWLRRILLVLLILVALGLIATQIVLWTDYPRRLVISLVQQQLGLRVEAASLSTGWFGNSTLRDVKLSLPLAQQSFLDMPRMTVRHTSLVPMLLLRKFELEAIELEKPNLVAQRDSAGRWNLQDVAELVARAGGGTPETKKNKPPALPRLRVNDAAIVIIERNGEKAVIQPLTAKGDPDGPLVYRYDIEVPDGQLKAVGQVAPGENFKHEVRLVVQPRQWLSPWMENVPTPLRLDAKWTGFMNEGVLAGRLDVQNAAIESITARGRLGVQSDRAGTVLSPQNFVIITPAAMAKEVTLASGNIQVANSGAVTIQQLRVAAQGGQAQFDGTGEIVAKTADLYGTWRELSVSSEISHSGNLHVTAKASPLGQPEVTGEIVTRGKYRVGTWDGQITMQASGRNWKELDWLVTVPRLAWVSKLPWTLENLSLRGTQRGSALTLTELRWPAADQLSGNAKYDLASNKWEARVRGRGTLTPRRENNTGPLPFDFNIDALGDLQHVHLNEVFVNSRGMRLRTTGDWVRGTEQPVTLSLYLTHNPTDLLEDEGIVRGRLHSESHISGTLIPTHLKLTGIVRSEDLLVHERSLGDMRGSLKGTYDGSLVSFTVDQLALFGGKWTVNGAWPYDKEDKLASSESLRMTVAVEQLSLKDVAEFFVKDREMRGTASGSWTIELTKLRREMVAAKGSLTARDVQSGDLAVDQLNAQMSLRNGTLVIDPIELRKGEKGTATATIETSLAEITKPQLAIDTQAWPVALGAKGTAAVWASTRLNVDAKAKSASGPIKARALIATTQQALGEANIAGNVDGRVARLDSIQLSALGGTANGRATIDADNPNLTNGVLTWSDIQGERLADLVGQLTGLTGKYGGALTLEPAGDVRALEPLRLRVNLASEGGKFRAVDIGPAKISAFINLDSKFVPQRIVLDNLPSEDAEELRSEADADERNVALKDRPLLWNDIRIADGRIKIWARRGQHAAGEVQTHFIADLYRLDLNQIVHAFEPNAKPYIARLSGQVILHGDARDRDALLGDGRIEITESDLANWRPLTVIYDALNVLNFRSDKGAMGRGSVEFRLQRSTLTLNNAEYFNRGIQAWSSDLTIRKIWDAPASSIDGYIVASARPLSAIRLPLVADLDQILSVLQTGLTTRKITGTLANPMVLDANLNDISTGFKQLLGGKVRESQK